jgi:hypothetical protein
MNGRDAGFRLYGVFFVLVLNGFRRWLGQDRCSARVGVQGEVV